MKKLYLSLLAACFTASASGADLSSLKTGKQLFKSSASGTSLSLQVDAKNNGGTITIAGPNGFYITEDFKGSTMYLNLLDKYTKLLPGRYEYHVTAHVGPKKLIRDTINNGRGENDFTYAGTPVSYNGSFVIEGGRIKEFDQSIQEQSNEW